MSDGITDSYREHERQVWRMLYRCPSLKDSDVEIPFRVREDIR